MSEPKRLSEEDGSEVGALLKRLPEVEAAPGAAQRSWRAVEGRLRPARPSRLGWFLAGAAVAGVAVFVALRPVPVEPVAVVAAVEQLELMAPGARTLDADARPLELKTPVDVLIVQHATAAVELTATGELVVRVTRGQVYVRGRDRWVSAGNTERFVVEPEPVAVAPVRPVAVEEAPPVQEPKPRVEARPEPARPLMGREEVPPGLSELVEDGPTAEDIEARSRSVLDGLGQIGRVVSPPREEGAARLRAALALRKTDPRAAATELRTLASSAALGEVALYELGRLEAGALQSPAQAVATFEEARARFPAGALRIELGLGLVESLLAAGRPADALRELDALSATSAATERADELTFLRAQLARSTSRHADAIALLAPLAAGASPFAERALIALADSQTRTGQADTARATLREYLRRFPTGRHAAEARRAIGP